nr:hypothetical protein [uncultured Psychroserpens sp.]
MIKIVVFALVILSSIAGVFYMADGKSDPFYKKISSAKQSSLILGSSRIGYAIKPSIIDKELGNIQSFNYAFTYNTSPYGLTYLNSVKQKLDTTVENQVFILGVDPWVLSNDSQDPNDLNMFLENKNFLGTITTVNSHPNFNYLIHNYSEPYIKILYNRSPLFVEDDGSWSSSLQLSDKYILKQKKELIARYTVKQEAYQFSSLRLAYLKQTISYLKTYGEVYLIRLPIDLDLLEVENKLMSNFDDVLEHMSNEMSVHYFNFSTQGDVFNYFDAHHMIPESANRLSLEIAKRIKQSKP